MVRILLSGAGGTMGRVVAEAAADREDCRIAAGFDVRGGEGAFPIYTSLDAVAEAVDVIIDFSHPAALDALLAYAVSHRLPLVIATTGISPEGIEKIQRASGQTAIFFSANMSLGVSLMTELAVKAAQVLSPRFDIEIIERHHNQKIDAPSGTALKLADAMNEALGGRYHYVYDRHAVRQKRDPQEIGIHAVRGGTMVGEHEILFAGRDELLTIRHQATSKEIFATGALAAAAFLLGRAPGLYGMRDLLG